ncbi:MAG: DUF4301 family protein [Deltaproteobacteria bacterium]|nr:DUF4301 family protein [Deltaproteobacteria bacterium]
MNLRLFSIEISQPTAAEEIDSAEIARQVEIFHRGAKPMRLLRPARIGDGIVQVSPQEREALIRLHEEAAWKGRMLTFVPASGAASRMFEDWYRCYKEGRFDSVERSKFFAENLSRFAFFDDLKKVMSLNGHDIQMCLSDGECSKILEYILTPKGLNYALLPKALLKFHVYPEHNRTAMEEHLVEAACYVRDKRNTCRIQFTVSKEHEAPFRALLSHMKELYEKFYRVSLDTTVTTQLPSTDTIAVDMENRPFKDSSGKILFRPGGHGALLQNLNNMNGDIIFVKNIDNVVPDRLKDVTVSYKKILGGVLVRFQDEIFEYLRLLSRKEMDHQLLERVILFCKKKLTLSLPDRFNSYPEDVKREWLQQKLNRPIRLCGMVKNDGEPGGGPFWVEEEDGTQSLQIVEQNQIDMTSVDQKDIWKSSTHFNPVDLVCGVRNYRGEKFDLNLYSNRESVTISRKSYKGIPIKALELPGLWNGGMAFWNTVFVEVPLETFNPVKTVDDLLRSSHQL